MKRDIYNSNKIVHFNELLKRVSNLLLLVSEDSRVQLREVLVGGWNRQRT